MKTIIIDFDGVIHSYVSKWTKASEVNDLPVPGAMGALVELSCHFKVAIISSRSHQVGGIEAMRSYIRRHLVSSFEDYPCDAKPELMAANIINRLEFPLHKPAATVTIDDRALQFDGDWSKITPERITNFKPWNKR